MASKGKAFVVLALIAIVVFALVYFGISLTSNIGKTDTQISSEDAGKQLNKLYQGISVTTAEPVKGKIDLDPADVGDSLPDISKFPVSVENTTDQFIEIFPLPRNRERIWMAG